MSEGNLALFEAIPILTAIATAAAGLQGVRQAVQGLLAKKAAKRVLARKIDADQRLRNYILHFIQQQPDEAEVEALGKIIANNLEGEITEAELKLIHQGLNQPRKSAERRYIEDLVSTSNIASARQS